MHTEAGLFTASLQGYNQPNFATEEEPCEYDDSCLEA